MYDHAVRQLLEDDLLSGAARSLLVAGVHNGQRIPLLAQGALYTTQDIKHMGVRIGDVGR